MKMICPTCGRQTLSLLNKITSTRFFRFLKKPARCPVCRGYYKTYINREYFFTVLYRSLIAALILTSVLMLSVSLSGFSPDIDIIPKIILIAAASLLFFSVFDLFFTGVESCNHSYQLIEHEIDIVLKNKNFSASIFNSIYPNSIISIKYKDTLYPAIIKKMKKEKKKCALALGFINPSFYPVEKFEEGDMTELISNGKTIGEFKIKLVITYK